MPATVETIEEQRIKRGSDGKISHINGKAISNESLILRKSGDETPLAEATDEIVYRARSSRGGECYFDFDPSSIGSYVKYLDYSKEPTCSVEGDGSTVYA